MWLFAFLSLLFSVGLNAQGMRGGTPSPVQERSLGYPSRPNVLKAIGSADFVLRRWQDAIKKWVNDDCDAQVPGSQSLQCSNMRLAQSSIKLLTETDLVSGSSMHFISNCLLEAADTAHVLSSLPSGDATQAEMTETFHALWGELLHVQRVLEGVVTQYLLAEDNEVQHAK